MAWRGKWKRSVSWHERKAVTFSFVPWNLVLRNPPNWILRFAVISLGLLIFSPHPLLAVISGSKEGFPLWDFWQPKEALGPLRKRPRLPNLLVMSCPGRDSVIILIAVEPQGIGVLNWITLMLVYLFLLERGQTLARGKPGRSGPSYPYCSTEMFCQLVPHQSAEIEPLLLPTTRCHLTAWEM